MGVTRRVETALLAENEGKYAMKSQNYKIDGYPVSRQELLDQASMIVGVTRRVETALLAENEGKYAMKSQNYKIDGYPVSRQELLDQASMIVGRDVAAVSSAKRILTEEGRDVTDG